MAIMLPLNFMAWAIVDQQNKIYNQGKDSLDSDGKTRPIYNWIK